MSLKMSGRRTLMTVFAPLAVVKRLYAAILFCTMLTSGRSVYRRAFTAPCTTESLAVISRRSLKS